MCMRTSCVHGMVVAMVEARKLLVYFVCSHPNGSV